MRTLALSLGWIAIVLGLLVTALMTGRALAGWNGELRQPRSEIYTARLGDAAYVAGGIGLFRTLASCERIDLVSLEAAACAPLPRALHHVALAADDRYLYASGGYTSLPFGPDEDPTLWQYDPRGDSWSRLAPLPRHLGQHTMHYREGRLLLVGGISGNEEQAGMLVYDLADGQWSTLAPMPEPRSSHAATIHEGALYVSGGRNRAGGSALSSVLRYDFESDEWSALPSLKIGRAGHGMIAHSGGLHVLGGEDLEKGALTPSSERLLLGADKNWSIDEALRVPRHGLAVLQSGDGARAIVIGGGARPGMQTIYSVTGNIRSVKLD